MKYLLTPAAMLILAWSIPSYSEPSVSRGLMLKMHGLEADAKRAFIDLLYNDMAHEEDKADALYQLGLIAFNNKDIGLATETWRLLIDEFPDTEKGQTVSAGIVSLLEDYDALILERQQEAMQDRAEAMRDAVAQSYLLNAQFWWDAPKQWNIYTAHINHLTMAREWYDKVVTEFPRTDTAKKAMSYRFMLYKDGMKAYWEGKPEKIEKEEIPNAVLELSQDFEPRILPLIHEYNKFVEDFPGDAVAHIMELQIAQEYHIGVKLIATWCEELEGMDLEIARQIIQRSDNIADESVRWCSLVPQVHGIVYQAAQATITDVRNFQDLMANELSMKARISRIKEEHSIALPIDGVFSEELGNWQFRAGTREFRMTYSDISVQVDGKTLSVPIEQFDGSENVTKFLESMIKEAKKQDKD